jgi:tetratricopeptide (TPR) repeat protein
MRLIAAAFILSIVCIPSSSRAEGEAAALIAICDQAAASPLDKNRPPGVAGVAPDKVDPKIAIPACEAAAKAAPTNPRIMYQLGRAYNGAKAYESARAQYEKADTAGYALAANNLAAIYLAGDGVLADSTRAMRLFEKAANAGFGFAMKNLGDEYMSGKHVSKDTTMGRRWYEKGAETGEMYSMMRLGVLYQEGKDVRRDYAESRRWYVKGASAGESISMAKLGYYYQNGLGGAQSDAEARRWYQKAVEAGNTDPVITGNLKVLDRPSASRRRGGRSYGGSGIVRGIGIGTRTGPGGGVWIGNTPLIGNQGQPCAFNSSSSGCY